MQPNHIPTELLYDIRSFYSDYSIVDNVYSTAYNQNILLYDLIDFFDTPHIELNNKIFGLWGRLSPNDRSWFINKYIVDFD